MQLFKNFITEQIQMSEVTGTSEIIYFTYNNYLFTTLSTYSLLQLYKKA